MLLEKNILSILKAFMELFPQTFFNENFKTQRKTNEITFKNCDKN